MKANKWIVIASITGVSIIGCAKQEQLNETTFTCSVKDITSGTMDSPAIVSLVEIETPSAPFSPLIITNLQEFTVDYEETFEGSFNAKRGNRYEYFLEFDYGNESYNSPIVFEGQDYVMQDKCPLSKKQPNACQLEIEPTLKLYLRVNNNLEDADPNDSIWVTFTDGNISGEIKYKGLGSSPSYDLEVPHGSYSLLYEICRGGELDETGEESFYLSHNQDTAITIQF